MRKIQSGNAGFTLVELAIVLVIIGLLITGLLKGAELISSAKVKSVIQQVRSLDAATTTFRDSYRFLPGDIPNAAGRIPNCAGGLCANTANALNANGRIDEQGVGATLNARTENSSYFQHLAAADLISGINIDAAAGFQFGDGMLESAFGVAGYGIGYHIGGGLPNQTVGSTAATAGHYLSSRSAINNSPGGTPRLRPVDVSQMDLKLDDGNVGTGIVRGAGFGNCSIVAGLYNTTTAGAACDVYVKIQN